MKLLELTSRTDNVQTTSEDVLAWAKRVEAPEDAGICVEYYKNQDIR